MNLMSEDEFLHRAAQVPMQSLAWSLAKARGVDIVVRRDDLVDTHLSGNKFYKLFYNLQRAKLLGHQQVVSFGGAHSNHLHALANAGRIARFKTIGVIRGERPSVLSPTLVDAEACGMHLHFVSRSQYQQKTLPQFTEYLQRQYGDFFSIPEGGCNYLGLQGTQVIGRTIATQLQGDYCAVGLPCGTGNTLAGVAAGITRNNNRSDQPLALGFSVLKGEGGLGEAILSHHRELNIQANNWRLISGFHGGGYGKKLPANMHGFVENFQQSTGIKLDPVYTAKMFWGVGQLLQQGYWPRGSRIVLIHTGGLQGCRARKP